MGNSPRIPRTSERRRVLLNEEGQDTFLRYNVVRLKSLKFLKFSHILCVVSHFSTLRKKKIKSQSVDSFITVYSHILVST